MVPRETDTAPATMEAYFQELASAHSLATASVVRKHGSGALPGHALGLIRFVRPATPVIEAVAEVPSVVVGLAVDDVRDVLEEDPAALAAIADRLAALLLEPAP